MLLNNFFRVVTLIISVHIVGCQGAGHTQPTVEMDSLIVNCYILKPVKNDSKADTIRDFDFADESLDDFIIGVISGKKPIVYDSSMDYVTSFEHQRKILLNYRCFSKLSYPDSSRLENIYLNSGFATWIKKRPVVNFLRTYKKEIWDFGKADIFEYQFNNVAEVEPHFMYIFLKEQSDDDKRYGRDYKGIVICSDGMDWKDYPDRYFSIPLFTQMVRRSKEFNIPLHYDGDRFVPIGHFKSNNWQD